MLRRRTFSIIVITILLWLTACQPQGSPVAPSTLTPGLLPTTTDQSSITASSSPVPTFTIQPAQVTASPGETPAPGSSLTFTQHGVTVTVTNLQISSTQTSLDFVAQVDPAWSFTFAQYDNPAQDVRSDQLPSLVDETGHIYQVLGYQGEVGTKRFVDPQTGIATTGGRFTFEPVTGSRLEIAIPLALQTVRASQPIRVTVVNPGQDQSLQVAQSLVFGELTAAVKAAQWNRGGNFELTVDGSPQGGGLRPVCLYLYQDPQFPPASYAGCAYDDKAIVDLIDALTFDPLPDFSRPVQVQVAADIVFLQPFRFVWVRSPH